MFAEGGLIHPALMQLHLESKGQTQPPSEGNWEINKALTLPSLEDNASGSVSCSVLELNVFASTATPTSCILAPCAYRAESNLLSFATKKEP